MFKFKQARVAALLSLATAAAFAAPSANQDSSLPANSGLSTDVVVNGKPISQNHVQLMLTSINPDPAAQGAGGPDAAVAARQELVTQELLAQEARKKGLDKDPATADQLAFQERAILSRAYLQNVFETNPVTDATLKSAYEWNKANGKIVEYKVRHILLTTPAQANEALAKLAKGEDFVSVAKVYTQDPGGQSNGGDLGWFRPDVFVDHHFTDALDTLKKGEYTKAPVRTRFGWHLIKVEDGPRAVAQIETWETLPDNVKEALRQKTVQLRIEELTSGLASKAKISGPGSVSLAKANK